MATNKTVRRSKFALTQEEADPAVAELLAMSSPTPPRRRPQTENRENAVTASERPVGESEALSAPVPQGVAASATVEVSSRPQKRRQMAAKRAGTTKSTKVDVPARLGQRVRAYNAATRVSFLMIVLAAIQTHASQLAAHWAVEEPEVVSSDSDELFPGVTAAMAAVLQASRAEKVELDSIVLAGMTDAQDRTLWELEAQWNAPSRRALITAALELMFPEPLSPEPTEP